MKFQYLLSVLSGEPLSLIKSLNITEQNYAIAYQMLKDRYFNKRRLLTLHLNQILDLPAISSSSVKNIRAFLNIFHEHTQSLKALDVDVISENPLLSALLLRKLDHSLVVRLEQGRARENLHTLPSVEQIIDFLNQECSHIEDSSLHDTHVHAKNASSSYFGSKPRNDKPKTTSKNVSLLATSSPPSAASSQGLSCFYCHQSGHKIYGCPSFSRKTPHERHAIIKQQNRCISCLGTHRLSECNSKSTCRTCNRRHHTMLHFTQQQTRSSVSTTERARPTTEHGKAGGPSHLAAASEPTLPPPTQRTTTTASPPTAADPTSLPAYSASPPQDVSTSTVLLGTSLVKLTASNGQAYVFRALIDSGSMLNFISEKAAQLMGTSRLPSTINVAGLSQTSAHTRGFLTLGLETLAGQSVAAPHSFHILPQITVNLPRVQISQEVVNKVKKITLADPTFHLPGGIDVLIGGALFPHILTHETYSLGLNFPHALGTCFGFVLMGTAPCTPLTQSVSTMAVSLLSTAEVDLHASLQRFWTQEELPAPSKRSAEEIQCDEYFSSTHTRDSEGRYIVRLPFKDTATQLGNSKTHAENRFYSLERKLHAPTNMEYYNLYSDFIHEYLSLGHMQGCPTLDLSNPHYFLPHHGVFKAQSSTTKLRVVFDASSKTSSGLSLNDTLLTGPKLQNNICDILLRFRLQNIVFSCDIRQMYRQIKVHPDDQHYQLILWRDHPTDVMSTFKLTTVTYGLNCSPYLAIKTLHQLAEDEGHRYPHAAEVLKHQSYVDDLICGAENEELAAELQEQLIKLLRLGGFELRKWVSNSPRLLQHLPEDHREIPVFLQPSQEPHFSILGLKWSPQTDTFTFNFNFACENPTKRKVLSLIAQVYDPCGFLAPCMMLAKNIMQLLWISGINWDDPLPPEICQKWHSFLYELKHVATITIPRAIPYSASTQWDLHGFSDASEVGYAAVVYIRSTANDTVNIRQIMAKTRVAPLKRVTLPRLELCAAHLLAQLVSYCVTQLTHTHKFDSIVCWCDSTVTLAWIKTPSYRLKTYVANRVAQTQELVPVDCWRYIPSASNPADCASRGILPSQLVDHPLWWHGPDWLRLPSSAWPNTDVSLDTASLEELGELKRSTPVTALATAPPTCDLLTKYSSWRKLLHVTAYVLRFIHNCRSPDRYSGPLSKTERDSAQLRIFKITQEEAFAEDLALLQDRKTCSTRLQRLAPFLDEDGLLRVGGRLRQADLPQDASHPCILPKKHPAVDLLIDHVHAKHLHSGVQLTLALLAQQVWILSARSVVRSRIFRCLTCFKNRPKNTAPLMGDLPRARITPARAFLSAGMDYGGPFSLKVHNLRSIRLIKAYICLFVCMVTKAVHIEVVTDLSTEAFLGALTRFVARRGLCTDLYSDCGTNFVGAKNALHKILIADQRKVHDFAANNYIRFHFNPPAAPHQGGIWESAIKSAKYHLKRVMGLQILTLSQFMTLTSQVEAMLNSRPLTALSSDPNDLLPLTPGHFLIGSPLVAVPEEDLLDTPSNRLSHWQLVQALHQRIWKRWHREYLQTLQQRLKWSTPSRNLQPGDLVLVHQDTPPLSWPLARVTDVTPGQDGTVRVVHLKTASGNLTRPAVKVFLLPHLSED